MRKAIVGLVMLWVLAACLPMPKAMAGQTVVTNVIPPTLVIGVSVRDPETLKERYFLTRTQQGFAAVPFVESIALERDCVLVVTVGGSAGSSQLKELSPRIDLRPIAKDRLIDPPGPEKDQEAWLHYQVGYMRYHGNGTCAENEFAAFATNKAPMIIVIDTTRLLIGPHTVDVLAKQEGRNSMSAVSIASFRLVESNVEMEVPNPELQVPPAISSNCDEPRSSADSHTNTGWTKVHKDANEKPVRTIPEDLPRVEAPLPATKPPALPVSAPRLAQQSVPPAPVAEEIAVAQSCGPSFELPPLAKVLGDLARLAENYGDWQTTAVYKSSRPTEVFAVFVKNGDPVPVKELSAEVHKVSGNSYSYRGSWNEDMPFFVFRTKPIPATAASGADKFLFERGDKIIITLEGRRFEKIIPQEGYNLWWVIDTESSSSASGAAIQPSAGALSVLDGHRSAARKRGYVVCAVCLVDKYGNLMPSKELKVVARTKTKVWTFTDESDKDFDGILSVVNFYTGDTVTVYLDGKEITRDIYGNSLPAVLTAGQEKIIYVQLP